MNRTALVVALSLALGGCPNPFDQAQQDLKQAEKALNDLRKLHTYLTNSPLAGFTDFSEAWVTLHKVEARNTSDNSSAILFEDPAGKSVNITRRDGIAELLSLTQVPTGTYDSLVVTIGSEVKIVKNDGTVQPVTLGSNPTRDINVTLAQAIDLVSNLAAGFALKFDLASFVPDGSGQILNPIVEFVADPANLQRLYGELKGTISAVDVAGRTVTVTLSDGTIVTLQIPTFATLLDEASKLVVTLADLKLGDIIQFFGNYNGNQLRMEVLSLLVNPQTADEGQQGQLCSSSRVEAEGYIVSYNSPTLVLDLEEASFLPESDTINLNISGTTVFTRGSEAMLTAGQEIEVRGSWDCNTLSADIVEVEDAPSNSELVASGYDSAELAEVDGTITAVNGNLVTLNINSSEYFSLSSGSMEVDLTDVWYKQGNASCLANGINLEIKGIELAGPPVSMQVSRVEIESCTTGTLPDDPAYDDSEESNLEESSNADLETSEESE